MRKQYKDQIKASQAVFAPKKDKNFSPEMIDFINQTIQRKPKERLGVNGINELKNHPWFSNLDWDLLKRKELPSPFTLKEVDYLKCVSTEDETSDKIYKPFKKQLKSKKSDHNAMFEGYEYNLDPIKDIKNEFLAEKEKETLLPEGNSKPEEEEQKVDFQEKSQRNEGNGEENEEQMELRIDNNEK